MSYEPPPYPPPRSNPPVPYGQPYPQSPAGPHVFPPASAYQQVVMTTSVPTSGWATASLVLGILGALGGWCMLGIPCVVAIIAGHVGLNDTKSGAKGGRGLATAGLILGYLFVVPWGLFFALGGLGLLSGTPTPSATPSP